MKASLIALSLVLGAASSTACLAASAGGPPEKPTTSEAASESRRFAVVVGINDYAGQGLKAPAARLPLGSERKSWKNLSGAVTDAESIAAMLRERYRFATEDVTLLTNQRASRQAIFLAIQEKLAQRVEEGDLAVFFFAGHGSRAPNTLSHELDAFDETLVPADVALGAPEIRDKELNRALLPILKKGAHLVVILDSCHSGSGTRGEALLDGSVRGLTPNLHDVASLPNNGKALGELGALVLSATQDEGLAWETIDSKGRPRGAFSWALQRALQSAAAGEIWNEIFARTLSLLRLESRSQIPVLEGSGEARQRTVLDEPQAFPGERFSFVALGSLRGGQVGLQGGRAHGLTEGTELVAFAGTEREIRLRIVELVNLARSLAEVVEPAEKTLVDPGTRFEVVQWAAPPLQPLRIWIPEAPSLTTAFVQQLANATEGRGIQWILDPTEPPFPSHRLRWTRGRWWLDGGEPVDLGPVPSVADVLARLKPDDRLFAQIPVPPELGTKLALEASEALGRVERVTEPGTADYQLVGRYIGLGQPVEFAWLLVSAMVPAENRNLPARSRWTPANRDADVLALHSSLVTLARALGWHRLRSQPRSRFPYHLEIRKTGDSSQVPENLILGQSYDLFLAADPQVIPENVSRRYVYVFAINQYGESSLLFPRLGSVENRFPLQTAGIEAARFAKKYALGNQPSFYVSEPLGTDTYFLIASREPLWNPWVLEFGSQVRSPNHPGSLDQLLWWVASGSRSPQPISAPMEWSIESTPYSSVRP